MFSNELAKLLLVIPAETRGSGILHKIILRLIDRKLIFIPNSNFWLPLFFPQSMERLAKKIRPVIGRTRRKIISLYRKGPIIRTEGSWHALHEWYRNDKKYSRFIENCLADGDVFPPEIFNTSELNFCWKEFQNGDLSRSFDIDVFLTFGLLHKAIQTSGIKFN